MKLDREVSNILFDPSRTSILLKWLLLMRVQS